MFKPRHALALTILGASAVAVHIAAPALTIEYFAVHIAEAEQVVTDCTAGKKAGRECDNAKTALDAGKARQAAVLPSSNRRIPSIMDSGESTQRRK
ncbi:hypothetical protein [Candidatus Burkholderia verschuerenii]|uniref:hypothetical protein n=1 Tax=Candidatus Burkholderia verschuerenii TaxID=242163 RepID=UPI000A7C5BE6|nr:hypothetical protein [Candidatus Burkholderia verschuerenii]